MKSGWVIEIKLSKQRVQFTNIIIHTCFMLFWWALWTLAQRFTHCYQNPLNSLLNSLHISFKCVEIGDGKMFSCKHLIKVAFIYYQIISPLYKFIKCHMVWLPKTWCLGIKISYINFIYLYNSWFLFSNLAWLTAFSSHMIFYKYITRKPFHNLCKPTTILQILHLLCHRMQL